MDNMGIGLSKVSAMGRKMKMKVPKPLVRVVEGSLLRKRRRNRITLLSEGGLSYRRNRIQLKEKKGKEEGSDISNTERGQISIFLLILLK